MKTPSSPARVAAEKIYAASEAGTLTPDTAEQIIQAELDKVAGSGDLVENAMNATQAASFRALRDAGKLAVAGSGASPRPNCPRCDAPMADTFKRVSVDSESAVRVHCSGSDLSFHQFTLTRLSDFRQFFPVDAGAAPPQLKELCSAIADRLAELGFHRDCGNNNRLVIENELETIEEVVMLAAKPSSAGKREVKVWELIAAAKELADTMETCHICKGALVLEESPVHCEDCSADCENHEEPKCIPTYILHGKLRKALKALEALCPS